MQPVLAIHQPPIFIPKWWFFCVQNYWVWNAKVVQISKINLFIIKNELFWLFFCVGTLLGWQFKVGVATLSRHQSVWTVVEPHFDDSSRLVSRLSRHQFKVFWSDPTLMTVRGWCRNYRDLSQTNCGWCRDRLQTNQKNILVGLRSVETSRKPTCGWFATGRDLSQTNQKLVCDTVATNHEMTNHEPYVTRVRVTAPFTQD